MRGVRAGAELLQQLGKRENFRLRVFAQLVELGIKLVADFYVPAHSYTMTSGPYVVKIICLASHVTIPGRRFGLVRDRGG